MIGFYDYTVILTLLSLVVSVFGITQAVGGHICLAVACLALSGLLDAFDGKVARTKKDRSDSEKLYGIQLDSLADIVCFGVFPVTLCYLLGARGLSGGIAMGVYSVCGLIRLAFFNVLETNRQVGAAGGEKVYHGLPITSIAVILPLVFLLGFVVKASAFRWILQGMLLAVGVLFVLDFRVKKPSNRQLGALIVLGACAVTLLLSHSYRAGSGASGADSGTALTAFQNE